MIKLLLPFLFAFTRINDNTPVNRDELLQQLRRQRISIAEYQLGLLLDWLFENYEIGKK